MVGFRAMIVTSWGSMVGRSATSATALAIGRSAWWSMYFVHAPIHAVDSGLCEIWAGAIAVLL